MNKTILTYGKRELKKVVLAPVITILYLFFLFLATGLAVDASATNHLLVQGYSEYISFAEVGDRFFYYLCEIFMLRFHWVVVWGIEVFLIQRLFYLENRDGVADFLRILPIREKDKAIVKIVIGECMILFFALSFGVMGTITYQSVNSSVVEANQMVLNGTTSCNGVLMLWQMAALMFVVMSAMFLVLYLAQCCIHHRAVAFVIGGGVLAVPTVYAELLSQYFYVSYGFKNVTYALFSQSPKSCWNDIMGMVAKYEFSWENYFGKMIFWGIVCVLALILIAVAVKCRWNIKESSNRIINSDGVRSFLIMAVSFSAAVCIASLCVDVPEKRTEYSGMLLQYVLVTSVFAVAFYGVTQGILHIKEKRLQNY